jgi:hypothetical protein
MKKQEIYVSILTIIILLVVLLYPVIITRNINENIIELYIKDYNEFQYLKDNQDFIFTFYIRNRKSHAINIEYFIYRETDGMVKQLLDKKIYLQPAEEKEFSFKIKKQSRPSKYVVSIPKTKQSIHFWTFPEALESKIIISNRPPIIQVTH